MTPPSPPNRGLPLRSPPHDALPRIVRGSVVGLRKAHGTISSWQIGVRMKDSDSVYVLTQGDVYLMKLDRKTIPSVVGQGGPRH